MFCFVASRISSDHWASKGCGMGIQNRMECGWSSSLAAFVVEFGARYRRCMCMLPLTPLWPRNT